jgi:hypothetical protein
LLWPPAQGQEDRGEDEDEASQGDGGAGELDGGKQDEPAAVLNMIHRSGAPPVSWPG